MNRKDVIAMELNRIKQLFLKFQSYELYYKDKMGLFLLLTIFGSLVPFWIIFIILYVLQESIEMNDSLVYPGDPAYIQFYFWFFVVMGVALSLFFGLLLYFLTQKRKLILSVGMDSNQEPFVYYQTKNAREYIQSNRIIQFDDKSKRVNVSTDNATIQHRLAEIAFWLSNRRFEKIKIKEKSNLIKVKFSKQIGNAKQQYVIRLHLDESGQLQSFSQTIYDSSYGSSNIKSMRKFYLENINRQVRIQLPKEIQSVLYSS
jgi:hypothetical protein